MNIFYLDKEVTKCAQFHCDKHVVKMILEYSQLLSSTVRLSLGTKMEVWKETKTKSSIKSLYLLPSEITSLEYNKYLNVPLYKKLKNSTDEVYMLTHINHPSTIWTRYSLETYTYMISLLEELCKEYTLRYSKIHKCSTLISKFKSYSDLLKFDNKGFVEPFQAMPEEYKNSSSVKAYRDYYINEKMELLNYTNRNPPFFIK